MNVVRGAYGNLSCPPEKQFGCGSFAPPPLSLSLVFSIADIAGAVRVIGAREEEVTKRRVTAAVPIPREGSKLNADDPTTRETSLWGAAAYVSVKGRL